MAERRAMRRVEGDARDRWRHALDAVGVAVWDWNLETGAIYLSDRWTDLTGDSTQKHHEAVSEWSGRIHSADRKSVGKRLRAFFHGEEEWYEAEYRYLHADGRYRWFLDRARIVEWTPDGRPSRLVGTIADITPRREASDSLVRTNEFLRDILESSSAISVVSTDLDGVISFWNSGAERILGYTSEEVVGIRHISEFYPADDPMTQNAVRDLRELVFGRQQTVSRVLRERHKNGSLVWMKVTVSPRLDRMGTVRGMLGIGEDISAEMEARARDMQREREVRLLAFTLNCAREGFCVTSRDYSIIYVNDALLGMCGYDQGEDLIGKSAAILLTPQLGAEGREEIIRATHADGWAGMIDVRKRDGSLFPAELSTSVVRNDEGEAVALVGVIRDVTDRVRADMQIRQSLGEKEVMLKEIHHRVKNNLQVINSLLNLQAAQEQNPAVHAALKESQGRVRSMALVHEELYRSRDLGSIEMGSYVRRLVSIVRNAYHHSGSPVELAVDVGRVHLPVDAAIPCGLIINELVSNSFKYAFRSGSGGTVTIRFHSSGEEYRLEVCDNGVGLPEDLDLEKTESLGMQLITTLAKQLRGKLTVHRSPGTSFLLEFQGTEQKT